MRRLQQRAALQSLNKQPNDEPQQLRISFQTLDHLASSAEDPACRLDPSSRQLGRQQGLPGRPIFEGGRPLDNISASLLAPGHQGELPLLHSSVNKLAKNCMSNLQASRYGPSHKLTALTLVTLTDSGAAEHIKL